MKIGVFGGSFNPVHLMHKEIVMGLLNKGYVDKVIILPTGNYYKKKNLLKGEKRIKMLSLAFNDVKNVSISDYEFKNNLISTYRSLDYFQSKFKDDEIYFIMGADNLKTFKSWKKYDYILDNYNLIIIDRDLDYKKELEEFKSYKGNIVVAKKIVTKHISSSFIRESLYNSKQINYLEYLDKDVYKYLKDNKIYTKDYQELDDETFKTEKEFLSNYSSEYYEKVSVTTDIVLFSVSDVKKDNYREVNDKVFSILLVKRNTYPFKNKYCLPGGFLSIDETLEDCAKRILFTETNLDNIYLEQLYTFSTLNRDPRTRVLSSSYLGLVDKNRLTNTLKYNADFFNVKINETDDIIILRFYNDKDSFTCKVRKYKDEYNKINYQEISNDYLAFDHLLTIITSIDRLKNKIEYSDLVFYMMPKYFTLKELQLVYEAILNKKLIDPVFRREIANKVIKTNKTRKDGGHRPSYLYKYNG